MSTRLMRIGTAVLAVFLLIYVAFQLMRYTGSSYSYQTVYSTTVEDNLPITGVFFRDEQSIPVGQSGVLSCTYAVGEKVPIGSEVARLYKSQEAIDLQREISSLEDTIDSLQRAQDAAKTSEAILPETLNAQIAQDVAELIGYRDRADFTSLDTLRTELIEAFARRQIVVDAETDYTGEIDELQSQLDSMKARDDAAYTSYTSDVAGYFVDHIDGYEDVCTTDALTDMSASDLDKFVSSYTSYAADSSHVKVVTDHVWNFAFTVTEDEALSLAEGRTVQIRFPNQSETVSMTVEELRRDVDAGEYLVILEGDLIDSYLLTSRVQACELIINTYTGLRVPKSAIRYEDGEPGVYVVLVDKMYFRRINVVYETAEFVVSAEDWTPDEGTALKLYDTVIVEGVGLYNQKDV